MINQSRFNKHKKASLVQLHGFTSERANKSKRSAFSNEDRMNHFQKKDIIEQDEIDQERLHLQMIKKELIQFQQDISFQNFFNKKRTMREFKESVEVFLHSVRFLIVKPRLSSQHNFSHLSHEGTVEQQPTNENERTFPQDHSIFQQNEETNILLKEQDRKILFGTSKNKESIQRNSSYTDEQLTELIDLLQILEECVQEMTMIYEQKSLLQEDELGQNLKDSELQIQIKRFEETISSLQNPKVFLRQNFIEFNKQLKLSRNKNIIQFYSQEYRSNQVQILHLQQQIQDLFEKKEQIKQDFNSLIEVKQEISQIKDTIQINDSQSIFQLFDMEFIVDAMGRKKNEDILSAFIILQVFLIQELEHLLKEKVRGCFSIYDCLLNMYDPTNNHLKKAINENPILNLQQKLYQERQVKISQINREKLQFIEDIQIQLLSEFPKLNNLVENLKNSSNTLYQFILENQNNSNVSTLFQHLHSQYKEKILTGRYAGVLERMNEEKEHQTTIEKCQQELALLEEKALTYKYKINKFKQIEEALISNYSRFNSQTYNKMLSNNWNILEEIKLNCPSKQMQNQSRSIQFQKINNLNQYFFIIESIIVDNKDDDNQIQFLYATPQPQRSPYNKSPLIANLEEQFNQTFNENSEEYQFLKVQKKCYLLNESIMELDLKREKINIAKEETIFKEHRKLATKEQFLSSSMYRTLKLIKYKFELIHNHQQSSYFSINSYGQAKLNTEERDRIIYQLLGEANLLCQDYESNFVKKSQSQLKQQYQFTSQQMLSQNNDFKQKNQSICNKQSRSLSAGKLTNHTSPRITKSSMLQNKNMISQNNNDRSPSIPKINTPQNILNKSSSKESKNMKKNSSFSFVENKVQKVLQSQMKSQSRNVSPSEVSSHQLSAYSSHSLSQKNINSQQFLKIQYSEIQDQQKKLNTQNVRSRCSSSSYHSNTKNSFYSKNNEVILQNTIRPLPDLQSNGSTVVIGSSNSSNSNKQGGNNDNSSFTVFQNNSSYSSSNQGTSSNDLSRYNQNLEHKYSQKNSMNQTNFVKKDTININKLLNENNSFNSNVSLNQIKSLINSPSSSTHQNNLQTETSLKYKINSSLASPNNNLPVQTFQQITNTQYLTDKEKENKISNLPQNQVKSIFSKDKPRTQSLYAEKQGEPQTEVCQYFQKQSYVNKQSQKQLPLSSQTRDYSSNTSSNHYYNSSHNGQSKVGVISININQLDQFSKDLLSGTANSNTNSLSTIEQEQQNFNLSKIHDTFNKTTNNVFDLDENDFVKFSFSNKTPTLQNLSFSNQQNNTVLKENDNITNCESNKLVKQNQTQKEYNLNSQCQSLQDKENNFIKQNFKSEQKQREIKNTTHRKLNSLLQAATLPPQEYKCQQLSKNCKSFSRPVSPGINQRAVSFIQRPVYKSPNSEETSIYEGTNDQQSNAADSSVNHQLSMNKLVSPRNNSGVYDGSYYLASPKSNMSLINYNSVQTIDLTVGIPVYVRFNSSILLKKKVFDPLCMGIKEAINLGYLNRILKFNKSENKIEFYKERLLQKSNQTTQTINSFNTTPKSSQNNEVSQKNSNKIEYSFDYRRLNLEKFIPVSQIKKISIPQSTQNLYKFKNGENTQYNGLHMDEKQLQNQNNYLLCIDGKDSGITEFIVNSQSTYQIVYSSLNSILSTS